MSHKYNARPANFNGYRFDSLAEMECYKNLLSLEQAGKISGLTVHPSFELQKPFIDFSGAKQQAIKYVADFSFIESGNPLPVVADVKGVETQAWRIKKRLFLYRYPEYELRVIK
jgi:hypothetical protein